MKHTDSTRVDQSVANRVIEPGTFKKVLWLTIAPGLALSCLFFALIELHIVPIDILPWIILATGVVGTFLMSKIISALISSNMVAEDMVAEQDIYLDTIIENMPSMVFVKESKELRFVRFNKAGEQLTGISREDMLGKNDYDFFPKEQADFFTKVDMGVLESGKVQVVEAEELDTPSGKKILRTKKVAVNMPNGEKFLLGISEDITKEKAAEAEREGLIKELSNSNEDLEKFAYVASHDLKSPLRSIDQLASWIQEDLGENIDKESKENMQLLRGRVKRLYKLLDDLLEYSRIGREMEGLDNPLMDCSEMIDDISQMLAVPATMKITCDKTLDSVRIRKMPLHQVLYNLINNSIKHHHKKEGNIAIRLEEDPDFYVFSVTDDGPGIPPEFQDKVFKMFHTLKPRDKVEGSGMGLAMVKKIVNNAGGIVTLKSDNQKGTTITFTWPKMEKTSMAA